MPCTVDGLMAWSRGWSKRDQPWRCRACDDGACRSAYHGLLSARLFLRAACRKSLICSCCYRGQLYCAADCAASARHGSRCALPDGVTRPAAGGGSRMGRVAIGRAPRKGRITVHPSRRRMICYRPARRRSPATGGAAPAHGVALPLACGERC